MTGAGRTQRIDALTSEAFAAQAKAALTDLAIDDEEIRRLACRYRDSLHEEPVDAVGAVERLTLPSEVQAVRRLWHLIADDIVTDRPRST